MTLILILDSHPPEYLTGEIIEFEVQMTLETEDTVER